MTPDEMKSLIARIQMNADFYGRDSDVVRLANALESAYDAGRRELAERFASQDATRRAAVEELIAWEDEIEAHVTSEDSRGATCATCGAHFSASGVEAGVELEVEHWGDSLHRARYHSVPTDGNEN